MYKIDHALIIDAIEQAPEALTIADIFSILGKKPSVKEQEVCEQILDNLVKSGKVFQYPPVAKNRKPRYYKKILYNLDNRQIVKCCPGKLWEYTSYNK